jgi:hypothetical protein
LSLTYVCLAFVMSSDYSGYFPDFGLMHQIQISYAQSTPIENLHAAWDGFWVVMGPVLVYMLYYLAKRVILHRKRQQVLQFIQNFALNDPFWNAATMKNISTQMFIDVQYAWMKNEFRHIGPWLSDQLKNEWQDLWVSMQNNDYAFFVSAIDIQRVTIIAAEDYLDDNKDTFKVEISGYIKRYIKNRSTNQLALNHDPGLKSFTDIYTFIRREDQWLLNHIQYEANFGDILL